jgi:hypothetical protein
MEDIDRTFERLKKITFEDLLKKVFNNKRQTIEEFHKTLEENYWTYEEYVIEYDRVINRYIKNAQIRSYQKTY